MKPSKKRTILAVAAHPADPIDCAAGTLAMHAEAGDRVIVLSLTAGARSHAPKLFSKMDATQMSDADEAKLLAETVKQKKKEFKDACDAIGAEMFCFDNPDEPFILSREVIIQVAEFYREHKPDVLITHHSTEMNNHDHPDAGLASLRAVTSAGRWLAGSKLEPHAIPKIYFYGMQFRPQVVKYHAAVPLAPTHVVNIEPVIEKKISALRAFVSQAYAGMDYASDEYIRSRIAAIEGNFGLVNGLKYAEEFIAYDPEKGNCLT